MREAIEGRRRKRGEVKPIDQRPVWSCSFCAPCPSELKAQCEQDGATGKKEGERKTAKSREQRDEGKRWEKTRKQKRQTPPPSDLQIGARRDPTSVKRRKSSTKVKEETEKEKKSRNHENSVAAKVAARVRGVKVLLFHVSCVLSIRPIKFL